MAWETPAWVASILSVIGYFWIRPESFADNSLYSLACAFIFIIDPPRQIHKAAMAWYTSLLEFTLTDLITKHFSIVLLVCAVSWLLRRGAQVLWKPVPELVQVLGVDIPATPDVSLAGIGPDYVNLTWTPPPINRPVAKYTFHVNGITVGEASGTEISIKVTGLKPDHFYNVRMIAVGSNYFQAGSAVIRIRTLDKNGVPQHGVSPLESGPNENDSNKIANDEDSKTIPSIEAATSTDGATTTAREISTVQRRGPRPSPSISSTNRPHKKVIADNQEATLAELNEKYEAIQREIQETMAQYAKEEAEGHRQIEELMEEKRKKQQAMKEKDEQTAQLKVLARTTADQMRAAEKEVAKLAAQLREKEDKKTKMRESIAYFTSESERMKAECKNFEKQKVELSKKRDASVKALNKSNAELQEKCTQLEAELKDKGKQLQDLRATREKLPGANDEKLQEDELKLSRDWELKRKDIHSRLVAELKQAHQLEQQTKMYEEELAYLQQQAGAALSIIGSPTGVPAAEYGAHTQVTGRRASLNSGLPAVAPPGPSPTQVMPIDPSYPSPPPFSHAPFAPGLFTGMTVEDGEDEMHAAADLRIPSGPLSPAAQDYLPSNIFDDMDDSDMRGGPYALGIDGLSGTPDPQSPSSSSRSLNVFSSPHGSSHNLPYQQHPIGRPSIGSHAASTGSPASSHRFSNLLSTFQRSRGARNSIDQGPPIGSLKSGQSQSFPRSLEGEEPAESKRRIGFPWINRTSTGPEGIAPSSKFPSRRFNSLRHSTGAAYPEGENSRPSSINSMDLPRPSTDSGSIWGTPGDGTAPKNRLWLGEGRWSSRSGSRRPSLHGTTSALTTTLASADDEILDEMDLMNPQASPSQVGVIGSRPPAQASTINQQLNPNAPTFMGRLGFRRDRDGDRSGAKARDRSKGKDKERKDRAQGHETSMPSIELPQSFDESPADSRISRDTYSVHTQTSVSESHDSFVLDASNAGSDLQSNAGSASKDQDNVVRKLFRKGSSSKFSLSSRLGKDSGLFKKGPGSTTNSADQRSSIGDLDDLGEDAYEYGRSYESMATSPNLVPAKSKDSKESRMSSWRFSMRKKGRDGLKEKDSLEIDRPTDEE